MVDVVLVTFDWQPPTFEIKVGVEWGKRVLLHNASISGRRQQQLCVSKRQNSDSGSGVSLRSAGVNELL